MEKIYKVAGIILGVLIGVTSIVSMSFHLGIIKISYDADILLCGVGMLSCLMLLGILPGCFFLGPLNRIKKHLDNIEKGFDEMLDILSRQ